MRTACLRIALIGVGATAAFFFHTPQLFLIEPLWARSSFLELTAASSDHSAATVQPSQDQAAVSDHAKPLSLRPSMLAKNIDELAGRSVKILNARVVGVFEPHAFLIESATRYEEMLGERDRILVLIDGAKLRVSDEVLVASTVNVLGVARTLLGVKVTAEVPWPVKLDSELVRRLEVRAAVLATSVRTPEGTELTDRRSTRTDPIQ
jgi:hypothetical protein